MPFMRCSELRALPFSHGASAVVRLAQSRAVPFARIKGLRPHATGAPRTARAFGLRRRARSRAPGPESPSLGSLGVTGTLP